MTQTAPRPTPTRTVDGLELPSPGTYSLDPSHSHVGFSVRHAMVAKVRGRFADFEGTVLVADDPIQSSVTVSIDLASIDTRDEGRDDHLRSADFFDVENHPKMTFESTSVEPRGDNRFAVAGDLTIHGVTRPVTLDTEFEGGSVDPWGQARVGFSATTEINREDFGLTWNQALEAGGVLVAKKVAIQIEVSAVRS